MEAGKYLAKIIDYGTAEGKNGNPYVFVKFQTTEKQQAITWFGNLKVGKATEITVDNLLKMGLRGNDLSVLAEGVDADALSMNKEFEIVVEWDEYNGNKKLRVKYINLPGEGGMERFSKEQAVQKLSGFKAEVLARRQVTKIEEPKPDTNTEDIPF